MPKKGRKRQPQKQPQGNKPSGNKKKNRRNKNKNVTKKSTWGASIRRFMLLSTLFVLGGLIYFFAKSHAPDTQLLRTISQEEFNKEWSFPAGAEYKTAKLSGGGSLQVVDVSPTHGLDDPPVMVLLHGFPQSARMWSRVMTHFVKKGFRVVAPDMRGYNNSYSPLPVADYDFPILVRDIVDVIKDYVKADKVILGGHDWGGAVAWGVAQEFPDLVDKLIVVNCPHVRKFEAALASRQILRSWYFFFFSMPPQLAEWKVSRDDFAWLKSSFLSSAKNQTWSSNALDEYSSLWSKSMSTMMNYYRAIVRYPKFKNFEDPVLIERPVLLIWGENDIFLGKEMNDGLDELVPNVEIKYLSGHSHWVIEENVREVNSLMSGFLSEEETAITEAIQQRKDEAERKRLEEEERKRLEEEERKRKEEEERKRREEAERKRLEEERKRKEEEERKRKEEEERIRREEAERKRLEEERKRKEEEERKRKEEEERKRKEEEERKRLEAERKRKEEEERKRKEEAEKKRLEEERKRKEEAERKRKEEAERKQKEEAEKKRLEAERKRKEEAEKKRLEAERKQKEEAEKKRLEAERKQKEEAEKKRLEAERKQKEEAEKKRLEAERKQKEEAERKRKEEEAKKAAERKQKEDAKRKAEEAAKKKEMEEAERKRKAEEAAKQQAESAQKAAAEKEHDHKL